MLDDRRETFLIGALGTGWIPDEMPDAQGGKIFSGIPTGQPGDGPATFILPDPLADLARGGLADAVNDGSFGRGGGASAAEQERGIEKPVRKAHEQRGGIN